MMALRNTIFNHCVRILKPYRQFSSSTIISKNLYKSSLPILSTPWLMLPPDVKDGPNGPTDNYLNIIDKSIIKIDRPIAHGSVPFNTMCVGSAKGWVAFQCDSDDSLFLANPYATEASCRNLPAPSVFPIYYEPLQFTLAGDPMSNNFALIMPEIADSSTSFLISKGGDFERWIYGANVDNDNGWRERRLEIKYSISRMAYNRNANTVYELHLQENSGKFQIICWYPLGDDENGKKKRVLSSCWDPKVVKKYHEVEELYYYKIVDKYLVVTEENDPRLFLVIRPSAVEDGVGCVTKDIKLFEIDLEGGEVKCVESIGDRALFIGANSDPFFISTRDCPGIKSNCVYIAEELGYYDLETKCITPFLSLGDLANTRPHVYWVAPPSFG